MAAPAAAFAVRDLGCVDYGTASRLQDELVEARRAQQIPDTLLLLEHPAVITLGRRGTAADIYASPTDLAAQGIAVERTTRGGLVTYHGPGQLVGYPIVDLRSRHLTIPAYVQALEQAVIDALDEIDVAAWRDPVHVGVWTARGKIAAIGVAQRHGVTLHGFAVNLQPDLDHFAMINPCGLGDLGVTSAAVLRGTPVDVAIFKARIAQALSRRLGD